MLKTTIKFIAENSSDFWLAPARRKIRHSIAIVCVCVYVIPMIILRALSM